MWKEYDELIKSDFADLRNCGNTPQAGTITAVKAGKCIITAKLSSGTSLQCKVTVK